VEKALEIDISFHRGPSGGHGRGLIYQGVSVRRVPLLGTLEDKLRKAPDNGISLRRGPFTSEGNLQ
jgi:hypothetical protein